MKSNQIFKADALAQEFPVLAPCIDIMPYAHVAMVNDVQAERYVLISYIWDTREVTQTCCIEHSTDEYDALVRISNCFRMSISGLSHILADDNLTWLRLTAKFDFNAEDYIDFINREVMTQPRKIKLVCKTVQTGKGLDKTYYIDELPICRTRKYREYFCHIDKKTGCRSNLRDTVKTAYSTDWNKAALRQIFGTQTKFGDNFNDSYPNLSWGYQGNACTGKEIKQLLMDNFNVIF